MAPHRFKYDMLYICYAMVSFLAGVLMEKKILSVVPLENMHILVWFESGDVRRLDAHKLIVEEAFADLANPATFKNVILCPEGAGLSWGKDLTVDASWVYSHSKPYDVVELEKRRLLQDLVVARHESELSQVGLGELSGIRQPVISRIESGSIAPQINTLFKLLAPMGKTLKIVDFDGALK